MCSLRFRAARQTPSFRMLRSQHAQEPVVILILALSSAALVARIMISIPRVASQL